MYEEKRQENKKVDKKALMIFIPAVILSGVIGVFVGAGGDFLEENFADVIANGLNEFMNLITPYVNLVLSILGILISSILMLDAKKRIKIWDMEDEEAYEKIDGRLASILNMTNIEFILAYFFFAAGFDYCVHTKKVYEMLCYFAGFLLMIISSIVIQSKTINLYKELNPEKQGSVYSFNFNKQWSGSCDEAEKMLIYKSAYGSNQVMGTFYIIMWLFCIFGNQIWHWGTVPVALVTLAWLVQYIAYQGYAVYYSKNPNKV